MSKFSSLALEVEKPQRMEIRGPNGRVLKDRDGRAAYIDLYSSDSEVARKHRRAVSQRRINDGARGGRPRVEIEEIESDAVDALTWLTTGWYLVGLDGEAIDAPFSRENAAELYSAPGMGWLREQVERFIEAPENFTPASLRS